MTWAPLHTCQRQLRHLPSLQPHLPFQLFFHCDRWSRYHLLLSWPFFRMGQAASTWEMLKYWIPYSWSATRTLKTFRSRCFKRILIHSRSPKYTGNVFFQKWHNLGPIWKVSCKRSRGVYLLTLYFFSLAVIVTYHFSSRKVPDFQCSKIPGNKRVGCMSADMKPCFLTLQLCPRKNSLTWDMWQA